jgi:hypothetical protein
MCRYSYRSGACANRKVESLECIGEEECEHSEMNVLVRKDAPRDGECGLHKWLGLYCEKYARFYCPGEKHCDTHETYMRHFEAYQSRNIRGPGDD